LDLLISTKDKIKIKSVQPSVFVLSSSVAQMIFIMVISTFEPLFLSVELLPLRFLFPNQTKQGFAT